MFSTVSFVEFVALELPMLYSSAIRKGVPVFEHEDVVKAWSGRRSSGKLPMLYSSPNCKGILVFEHEDVFASRTLRCSSGRIARRLALAALLEESAKLTVIRVWVVWRLSRCRLLLAFTDLDPGTSLVELLYIALNCCVDDDHQSVLFMPENMGQMVNIFKDIECSYYVLSRNDDSLHVLIMFPIRLHLS
ncbi:unnamed protein product [Eruca vesicaria subsp. sativa]|uniref:Uncharacterized protein n=1 Tax=Eruca vesicaria subsp. sativa TaxID=29727 RepID=A0ABC8L0M5_ERUVS|nr:unnamed protein product [Eruca vesicaria subsp. sativa]